ncbi:TauD/TfdA family dioxygenase [Rhodospirillaceae bacterium SYSU D60014]|uniref:TauD/TfdA family dioxygenase n=1 Tax=Virgifigura deserti TaxID=2268457 RepID=UPI000E674D9B
MENAAAAPAAEAPIPDFDVYPVRHTIASAGPWSSGTELRWSDGHTSRFHGLWLRDNCPCPNCVNPVTREQVFDISTVPEDVAPTAISVDEAGALLLNWPDGHESRYHPGWLRAHCYSVPATAKIPVTTWGGGFDIPTFDGRQVLDDDKALLEWLEALRSTGLTLLRKCPLELGAVEHFADRIAFLRETNFGRVFDVRSKVTPDSNAYTALELPLHTDLPTRELQPGLQFLLCRVNDATGGDSIMADGFRIAEALRIETPEHFRALTTLPMEFRNRAQTSDYRTRGPAIRLNDNGEITEIRLGNFLRGPMRVAEQDMPLLYAAYRRFMSMTREDRFRVSFRLNAGCMAAFDNRRVLHARSAFDPASGDRHLQGCYVDTDELLSRIRILRREPANGTV